MAETPLEDLAKTPCYKTSAPEIESGLYGRFKSGAEEKVRLKFVFLFKSP